METRSDTKEFPFGKTIITRNARARLQADDVCQAFARHARGDWGELNPENRAENDRSLEEGDSLLSVYTDRNGVKSWILTEADRSVSTCLLPEDY